MVFVQKFYLLILRFKALQYDTAKSHNKLNSIENHKSGLFFLQTFKTIFVIVSKLPTGYAYTVYTLVTLGLESFVFVYRTRPRRRYTL